MRFRKRKSNDLFELPEKAKKIHSLEVILPDYNISDYGTEFLKFENLKELYVQSHAHMENLLPQEIGDLVLLEKLYILNFNYKEFPNWIFKLKNIKQLMLRGNNVDYIPKQIKELSALEKLRIENCKLADLPDSIANLNNLRELSLSANSKLIKLNIDNLPNNLKILNLAVTGIIGQHLKEIELKCPHLKINRFVN
ncbi:hypothetical protein [uncultured Allomuricauda sp.]|uniref:leucine-rich repeat domain-containing protein n=1 Tax=Flagellimonas sp. W118 TaxID=3410791 RepID=UPI00260ACDC0|nr:hypothetical protein [uncultured Allomuricauda sp.]